MYLRTLSPTGLVAFFGYAPKDISNTDEIGLFFFNLLHLLICLSLKVNNDPLDFPPKSDQGNITHHRQLCRINSCTDLVSVQMHLDKFSHSHPAPSHTKPIHSMQLVLIILYGDVSSNLGPFHHCGVCHRAVTIKCADDFAMWVK